MTWLKQLFLRRRRFGELSEEIREHLEQILALARRAEGEVHTYLKFYGD